MPGIDGLENMRKLMTRLRENPPADISGVKVLRERDYASGKIIVPGLGFVGKTHIAGSNVLYFELDDDTSFIVRPSGTEPKIKVYILVSGEDKSDCEEKINKYSQYAENLK